MSVASLAVVLLIVPPIVSSLQLAVLVVLVVALITAREIVKEVPVVHKPVLMPVKKAAPVTVELPVRMTVI